MAIMKAAQIHEWNEPVQVDDIPVPEPQSDEVLIRVHAAGLNPIDWKVQAGYMQQFLSLPRIMGWELAGEIVALGDAAGASGLKIGDAVYAKTSTEAFAQFVAVETNNVAPKPKSVDYETAAALPAAALTAWQALFDHGGLLAGQKVLIHGAAGGVGHFAVQLARWKGATVIGTGSAENEVFVRGLGADDYINYRTTRFEDVVQDADVVFDTVGGETFERSYAAAKSGGIVVTIAARPSPEQGQARGVRTAAFSATGTRAQLDALTQLVDAGTVKATISAVYPLDQVQAAIDKIKEGHTRGKIILQIP